MRIAPVLSTTAPRVSHEDYLERRSLGATEVRVSAVAMGCWPIAGMSSLGVSPEASVATLRAAFEVGINFFDAAYCYGADGESERLIAQALGRRRSEIVIATKGGIHWDAAGNRVLDARPATLRRECEISLARLQTDYVDLLYLHAPDPQTPVAESVGALAELQQEGKTRCVGVSNVTFEQLRECQAVCPLAAFQPPYNLLQRQIERDMLPWCRSQGISVVPYWPLMKGLLAGKLARDHTFAPGDGRAKYPMFQGEEWERNQDFVDRLRALSQRLGRSVAQIAINWVIGQPGIASALCGAKRPEQICESAAAMQWRLSDADRHIIDEALRQRGEPMVRLAV